MKASGSYGLPVSPSDAEAEIERLAAQADAGWQKESRALSWFGLKDGMSVVEVGSGPGFITERLLTFLPTSTVTCVEIDGTLLDRAKQRLSPEANRVRFAEASVLDTQLESDQFDFAYARLLFQHLPDPIAAAKEMWRVLKPGGKLVISELMMLYSVSSTHRSRSSSRYSRRSGGDKRREVAIGTSGGGFGASSTRRGLATSI